MAIKVSGITVIDNGPVISAGGTTGTSGQVLQSTGVGITWVDARSGSFDTGITTSIYVGITSGVGGSTIDNNNIFVGPGVAYTFPSTAGREYIIESIHVSNKFTNDLYLSGRHDYNGGTNTPIAQRVVIPYQSATDLIIEPIIAGPSDTIRLQALAGVGSTATGVTNGLDAFIVFSTKSDTSYVGVGTTVTSTGATDQTVFTSTSYPSVIQSIRLINYNLNVDVDANISIYRGASRLGYLVYKLTIPKNSIVEILEKPKYLATSDSIRALSSNANGLSVCISGRYIV